MIADENSYPERLYHYTNLASLALILQNRTLRLMPLTGMDDPQENQTEDITNLGRFFFASCWTDEARESIPMWNMYASLDSGVRIDLPPMPFKHYKYTAAEMAEILGIPEGQVDVEGGVKSSFMPFEDLRDGRISPSFLTGQDILKQVEYTDELPKLRPAVVSSDDTRLTMSFKYIGVCKNTYWEFQHEWRYLMCIVPFNVFEALEKNVELEFYTMVSKMIQGSLMPVCPYYDLRFSDQAFMEMGIVPSPKMSAGNRVVLSCLLEKFGLVSNLKHSQLEGSL